MQVYRLHPHAILVILSINFTRHWIYYLKKAANYPGPGTKLSRDRQLRCAGAWSLGLSGRVVTKQNIKTKNKQTQSQCRHTRHQIQSQALDFEFVDSKIS